MALFFKTLFEVRVADVDVHSTVFLVGRMIPTTPWEAIWHGVAQWLGITDKAVLDKMLPHAKNF